MKIRIGLTGGIATGKTTAAKEFERLGAFLIDYDLIAHNLLDENSSYFEPGLLDRISKELFLLPKKNLTREDVAKVIFGNEAKRKKLNSIIHPSIIDLAFDYERANAQDVDVVVHDVPLLFESNLVNRFDEIVVVCADYDTRFNRLVNERKISPKLADKMILSQIPDKEQSDSADFILDGSGMVNTLNAQVISYYNALQK